MPVRPFTEDDIPQVAVLHHKVFRDRGSRSSPPAELQLSYHEYFQRVFLSQPWPDENLPSLVWEKADGRVGGFLGVMPRRLILEGQPVRGAVSSQFVVDPEVRGVGLQLLRRFLAGPQELSLADDANSDSLKIWEALGGVAALPYSIRWTRLLRPSQFAVSQLRRVPLFRPLAAALRPACRLADRLAMRMLPDRFDLPIPPVSDEELTADLLACCVSRFTGGLFLRPDYEGRTLGWLLESLAQKGRWGPLRKRLLRNSGGEIIGWYLYHLKPGDVSTLLQIGGTKGSIGAALDHLFHDAWRNGSVAITGSLEPRFMRELWQRRFVLLSGRRWTLVHSKNRRLLDVIHRGDAFLSRLEGEWCMRFQ